MSHLVHLQLYRGPSSAFPPSGVSDGEPVWVTDTHTLWIAQGGVLYPVGAAAAFGSQSANRLFGGPASGAAAMPTFRALVPADLVAVPVAEQLLFVDDTPAINQTANVRYKGGRLYQLNAGPPVLADLRTDEWSFSFVPAAA